MTASLWRELATYAAIAVIVAAVLCHLDGKTRTAVVLGVVGGVGFVAALTLQALGIA